MARCEGDGDYGVPIRRHLNRLLSDLPLRSDLAFKRACLSEMAPPLDLTKPLDPMVVRLVKGWPAYVRRRIERIRSDA